MARLRYSLPETVTLLTSPLLDSALTKMRAAANDALVQRTLHPPRIPLKPAAAGGSAGSSASGSGQASSSGTRPAQQTSSSSPSGQSGKKRKNRKDKAPFSSSSGGLEVARDPGPGFYSRLFLVERASGGWRPVVHLSHLNEFVQLTRFKIGNSSFCTVICQRGGFSSFLGSERRVLSDPDPSIFEEAIEVHVGGDSLPVPSTVFRTVDRSPGLCGRFSLGTLTGSDFSAIWTTGWFSPPRSGKPNRPSSRFSRFDAPSGL